MAPQDTDTKTKIERRAERTVTRADLAEVVYASIGTTRAEAGDLVDAVFEQIFDKVCQGETVKLHNFGKFVIRHKGKREGRNPRTLEPAEITPRQVVQFKASPAVRDKLNKAPAAAPKKKPRQRETA